MFRRLLLVAVITAVLPAGAALAPGAANAATSTTACSGVIAIDQFAFNPPSVPAGQTSTLNLVAQNCTNQTVQGQTTWFGQYTRPGGGIPPGCPAIDPIALPYTIASQASYSTTRQDGDTIAGCQATGLQITVRFSENNVTGTVAQATAAVTQTGSGVSATNMSYNATIPPGGSQSFGFQGTWVSSDASPASFSVDGTACS